VLLLGLLVIIAAPADLRSISLFYLFLISDVVERAPEVERETQASREARTQKKPLKKKSRGDGLTRQKQQRKIFAARAIAWDCVVK
jgi:hypothetical protein